MAGTKARPAARIRNAVRRAASDRQISAEHHDQQDEQRRALGL